MNVLSVNTTHSRAARALEWLEANSRRIALGAVVLALVLAGGYAVIVGGGLRFADEQVYTDLARQLASGHGYSDGGTPTAYRPPGYPFLLLPFYLLGGGSVVVLRLAGVLCFGGAVWFTYLVGRRTGSAAAGALAAAVLACYPLMIYTSAALYPQVPALLLLLVMIEFGLRAVDGRRRWTYTVLSGLCGGLLTITVPSFAPSILLLVAAMVWRLRRGVAVRMVALLLIAAAVIPVAWSVRNAVSLHAFVPVSTNNGVNLLLGNNADATPSSGTNVDISAYDHEAKARGLDEVGIDGFYRDSAVHWMAGHVFDATMLYSGKVAHTFVYSDSLKTGGQAASDLLAALTYYPVLALALLRLFLTRRFPLQRVEKLAVWVIVVNVLLLAVFFSRVRFRVPLDGLTIILAASAAIHLLRARGQRQVAR
jgi:4-amino-4-deoxy-L-arabinose transferase-like glycosyltransferase